MKLLNLLFIFSLSNIFNNKVKFKIKQNNDLIQNNYLTNNYLTNNYLSQDNNLSQDDNLIKFLGFTLLSLPYIFRNGEICESDTDCPHKFMKCCQIGNYKYCCTPNNYIKLEFAYAKKFVK